jgi:aspartyl-tRNA(Asn)/glutamyl-tRNA(Gln) amidotransferase subunit A
VPLALGSDTGGSVGIRASFCGVVGLKPTFGRISRDGIVPHNWSLDHPGPLARSVEDAALALGVLAGHDPRDPACQAWPVPDCTAACASA